ncbi:MAG: hypothetical protein JW829_05960 [Pirellulales bacterium]|nr:hypothetical protein [Pirellulales bacterium]
MRFKHHYLGCALLATLGLLGTSVLGVEFDELTQYVPEGANAIVTLNVEKTLASPLAQEEKWGTPGVEGPEPLKLPPQAKRFVLAAHFDFEYMRPVKEVAVFELGIDPSMDFIVQHTKGTLDQLGGLQTVETPKDAIVVKFAPNVFGAIRPADRQIAARWIRQVTNAPTNHLTPYLQKAASYPDRAGTNIVMAMDLEDVLRRKDIRQALEGSELLKKQKGIDLDAVADSLASIQGFTLGILVEKRAVGELRIDFTSDTAPLADIAKPLFLEAVGEAGAMVQELQDWQVKVESHRVSFKGDMTRSGFLRLFSLFELDTSEVSDKAPTTEDTAKTKRPEEMIPYTSKQYYDAVDKYLVDLSKEKGAVSFGQMGLWFQKYARKIDALPILNVDPDLVSFGAWTVEQLRNATASIQGVGIRSGAREAQVYNTYSGSASYSGYGTPVRYGWNGYRVYGGGYGTVQWDVRNVEAERRAIRSQERAQGATEARGIVKQIESEQSKIRRTMSERYKMEF